MIEYDQHLLPLSQLLQLLEEVEMKLPDVRVSLWEAFAFAPGISFPRNPSAN